MSTEPTRKGYLVAVDGITDMDRFMEEYIPTAAETIDKHNGEILVASLDPQIVEGEWGHTLTVVLEFPSVNGVEEWYQDEVYQEVAQVRRETCEYSNLVILPGFSPEDFA